MDSVGRLVRRTTSDDVADALRAAIIRGDYQDGAELNQVALAKQFGISRVPVREALRELQAEGLISATAHMRAVVTGLTPERLVEALDLRERIESYLLGRSAPLLTTDDLAEITQMCDELERIDGDEDHRTWLEMNKAFHARLYAGADAELAKNLVRQLVGRVDRYLHLIHGDGVHRTAEANAEHRRIVEALQRGEVERACRELESHIGGTRARIVAVFEERRREAGDAATA